MGKVVGRVLRAACVWVIGSWVATAHAQTCVAADSWNVVTSQAGPASSATNDTMFNPTPMAPSASYAYIAQGRTLQAYRNKFQDGMNAGTPKWAVPWQLPMMGTTIDNFPNPVPLTGGAESTSGTGRRMFIFLAGSDGFLYKINADTGQAVLSADLKRTGCLSDSAIATPAVQLFSFSNCAFKNAINGTMDCGASGVTPHRFNDLVFVITRYDASCNDGAAKNEVRAYYSSDFRNDLNVPAPLWTFGGGSPAFDFGTDGCYVSTESDTLYCGTALPSPGSPQISLFALDTLTGTPRWTTRGGSILNRPQMANGKLYVTRSNGSVQVYDPAGDGMGGARTLWQAPIQVTAGTLNQNVWPESRGGPFNGNLLAVDSLGRLIAIGDHPLGSPQCGGTGMGPCGSVLWTLLPGGTDVFTSQPAILPSKGWAYVGRSDGRLQQINLSGGALNAAPFVNAGFPVFDPALDVNSPTDTLINRVSAVADGSGTGRIARRCLNTATTGLGLVPPSSGAIGCSSQARCNYPMANDLGTFCSPWQCAGPAGGMFCVFNAGLVKPDGTPCSDDNDATCDASHADANGNCTTETMPCSDTSGSKCNDVCRGGVCVSDFYWTNSCTSKGDRACTPPLTCCGGGVCANLTNDARHCGDCDTDCGAGACINGVCQ